MSQCSATLPVADEEITKLYEYASSHSQMFDLESHSYGLDAVFAFGRGDRRVSVTASITWIYCGEDILLLFTGGANGKDTGDIGTTEAGFLGHIAKYEYGVPEDKTVLETEASHGGENCRLGYAALKARLGRAPRKIVLVIHATSARRLAEQLLTIAEQEGWPELVIHVQPTDHPFDPANPVDRAELLGEMDRLLNWPIEKIDGQPKLRPQPKLPADLEDIYRRLKAEQNAA